MYDTDAMSISISMYIHIQKMKPETSVQVVPMLENYTVVTKLCFRLSSTMLFLLFPFPPPVSSFVPLPTCLLLSPSPAQVLSSHLCLLLSSSFQVSSPLPPPLLLFPHCVYSLTCVCLMYSCSYTSARLSLLCSCCRGRDWEKSYGFSGGRTRRSTSSQDWETKVCVYVCVCERDILHKLKLLHTT